MQRCIDKESLFVLLKYCLRVSIISDRKKKQKRAHAMKGMQCRIWNYFPTHSFLILNRILFGWTKRRLGHMVFQIITVLLLYVCVHTGHFYCLIFVISEQQLYTHTHTHFIYIYRPPLWSSGQSFWLQIQRSRVRFPALPDFLSGSGSGTGYTQPREFNWGATWIK